MKLEVGATPSGSPNSLAGRIAAVRERIDAAAREAGRDPARITLVGVTKKQPREAVVDAVHAGLRDVAENYVQEARAKYDALPAVRKHFIGHVQTNKAKAIVSIFDVVQSIDRLEAGLALAKAASALGKRLPALVQVNVSPTERFGVAPGDARALAERLRDEPGLDIDGVMAIGPLTGDPALVRDAFARAAEAFADVGGTTLSIGMSDDFEAAVAAGSTMVRLGTAIFGPRAQGGT